MTQWRSAATPNGTLAVAVGAAVYVGLYLPFGLTMPASAAGDLSIGAITVSGTILAIVAALLGQQLAEKRREQGARTEQVNALLQEIATDYAMYVGKAGHEGDEIDDVRERIARLRAADTAEGLAAAASALRSASTILHSEIKRMQDERRTEIEEIDRHPHMSSLEGYNPVVRAELQSRRSYLVVRCNHLVESSRAFGSHSGVTNERISLATRLFKSIDDARDEVAMLQRRMAEIPGLAIAMVAAFGVALAVLIQWPDSVAPMRLPLTSAFAAFVIRQVWTSVVSLAAP